MLEIKRIPVGPLRTNCYLLFEKGEIVVVDPGDDEKEILNEIKNMKGKVKYILTTHPHFDHTLKKKEIAEKTQGKILDNLEEGDEVKIGESSIKVLKMMGHTREDICLLGKGFMISGDVIFLDGHGRTDLPGGSEEEMEKSLQRIEKEISKETVIYPGHGKPFLMRERQRY